MSLESDVLRKISEAAVVLREERALNKARAALDAGKTLSEKAQATISRAAARDAEFAARTAAIEEGRNAAGTKQMWTTKAGEPVKGSPPRIGVSQREAQALKEQSIRQSGEAGYRDLQSQMGARLQEGGEFPLRFSRTPSEAGTGSINPLGRTIYGEEVTLRKSLEEHAPRIVANRGKQYHYNAMSTVPKEISGDVVAGFAEAVDRRAARGEQIVRQGMSGVPAAFDQPIARSAAVEFSRKGAPRGIRSIAQGVSTSDEYQKMSKAIQGGMLRAAPVAAAGGYAAQGWGEIAGTYTGPAKSGRTPQVQWGRNRQ